jgi:hypothetical protein
MITIKSLAEQVKRFLGTKNTSCRYFVKETFQTVVLRVMKKEKPPDKFLQLLLFSKIPQFTID